MALDLKQAAGQSVLHRLVMAADVLVTNDPPQVRSRLGLAWEQLEPLNARLVGADVVYRQPRHQPRNALTNFYRCRDGRGFILSLIAEERASPGFAPLVGLGDLQACPRFATLAARRAHAQRGVVA